MSIRVGDRVEMVRNKPGYDEIPIGSLGTVLEKNNDTSNALLHVAFDNLPETRALYVWRFKKVDSTPSREVVLAAYREASNTETKKVLRTLFPEIVPPLVKKARPITLSRDTAGRFFICHEGDRVDAIWQIVTHGDDVGYIVSRGESNGIFIPFANATFIECDRDGNVLYDEVEAF